MPTSFPGDPANADILRAARRYQQELEEFGEDAASGDGPDVLTEEEAAAAREEAAVERARAKMRATEEKLKKADEARRAAEAAGKRLGPMLGPPKRDEDEVSPYASSGNVNLLKDILWVYDALGRDVARRQAPSSGAWEILEWVRLNGRNRSKFFETLLPKAWSESRKTDNPEVSRDHVKRHEEILEILSRYDDMPGVADGTAVYRELEEEGANFGSSGKGN